MKNAHKFWNEVETKSPGSKNGNLDIIKVAGFLKQLNMWHVKPNLS